MAADFEDGYVALPIGVVLKAADRFGYRDGLDVPRLAMV
jgi:hypothetical protein